YAVRGGLVQICERLIQAGLDPNSRDSGGQTPLHVATTWGFPTIQRLLVEAGGDLGVKDSNHRTPVDIMKESWRAYLQTERIRLFRMLPETISAQDALELYKHIDVDESSDRVQVEARWHKERAA